jgi:hypothetical protein
VAAAEDAAGAAPRAVRPGRQATGIDQRQAHQGDDIHAHGTVAEVEPVIKGRRTNARAAGATSIRSAVDAIDRQASTSR